MSTQSDHGHDLVPRPEQTPDALRAALAVVDPGRLEEMQATKDEAFAKAVEWQSTEPCAELGPGLGPGHRDRPPS
jgi:hypothetical protein